MLNDYKRQALVWDWDGYDDSPEYEYWCSYAERFGKNVLIPMCAHGKIGAYMAEKGFNVTAFDITPEMIVEGKKRYGNVKELRLTIADLLNLDLKDKHFDFVFIAGSGDLHLLQSIHDVEKALVSLRNHMKTGSCLVLELSLPSSESWISPMRMFHPRVPNYTDKKIWKENEGKYVAEEKRQYITQTVYIEDDNGTDSFVQSVCLQYYEREEILELLGKCSFDLKGEYKNKQKEPWTHGERFWIVEATAN